MWTLVLNRHVGLLIHDAVEVEAVVGKMRGNVAKIRSAYGPVRLDLLLDGEVPLVGDSIFEVMLEVVDRRVRGDSRRTIHAGEWIGKRDVRHERRCWLAGQLAAERLCNAEGPGRIERLSA